MGTKNNPGPYDCFAKAEPDEPRFTVLGRDPQGGDIVHLWAALRCGDIHGAERIFTRMSNRATVHRARAAGEGDKIAEAVNCAEAMRGWRKKLDGEGL